MRLHVGLDIGIASVGWCVVDDDAKQITGIGVRTFTRAENPKTGASLALPRRLARSARRRLKRRRLRMHRLRDLFVRVGMLSPEALAHAFEAQAGDKTPYELRVEGLDRRLPEVEWARILSQICKRRGYLSTALSDKDDDEGAVKGAIAANESLMRAKGYRTAGEMLLRDDRFTDSKRNKGDYKSVVARGMLLDEIALLFSAQRNFGNRHADAELEAEYLEIVTAQAAIKEGPELMATVGRCSLDRTNRRVSVACISFERFRFIDKLHNVRYTVEVGGPRISLTLDQMAVLIEAAFDRKSSLTYVNVRKLCDLPAEARFVGVRYNRNDGNDISAESKERLPLPRRWVEMRELVTAVDADAWAKLAADTARLNQIAEVLTFYKRDDSVRRELSALGLDAVVVDALSGCRFSGVGHLSRETIDSILPHMEAGLQYKDACLAAGFSHSQTPEGERHDKLPPVPVDDVRNPVVLRALTQSRKVLNAIITEFGPIEELHVELGRDVAKSADDRSKIERKQKENRAINESVLEDIHDLGRSDPSGQDILKFKLWKEQGKRCAYSGTPIDERRLLSGEPGVAEVDHILPHGRSFDDSYMNKVLVTAVENQRKGSRTPFEYLGGDADRWHEFEERVSSMHLPRPKMERLLRKDFDERAADEFRERNLVDTQYTARYFKDFVEENLRFAGEKKRPVVCINGRATAYLRNAWRLQKVRADGDLHHAMDAAVVAVSSPSMIQSISRFFSVKPLRNAKGEYYDPATGEVVPAKHIPEPWDGFRDALVVRLEAHFSQDPIADLAEVGLEPKPILVSRMPNRAVRGEVHKETVRRIEGHNEKGAILTSKRVRLVDLKLSTLEKMVGRDRDSALYEALRQRLVEHGDNGAKAFAEPITKPTKLGRTAPPVRAIRVYDSPSSGGTYVRGGLADNGEMVRVDVFERSGRFYLVPIYLKDVVAGELPSCAMVAFQPEDLWRQIDDTYRFVFSLCINDPVRLVKKSGQNTETWFGYFKGANRSTGGISIQAHDSSWRKEGLGVALGVASFEKYGVDALGLSMHRVRQETRLGFSHGGDRERG